MSLSCSIPRGEASIITESIVPSNSASTIEKMKDYKGGCYLCKSEPTDSEFQEKGTTCRLGENVCDGKSHWEIIPSSQTKMQ